MMVYPPTSETFLSLVEETATADHQHAAVAALRGMQRAQNVLVDHCGLTVRANNMARARAALDDEGPRTKTKRKRTWK